MNKTFYRFWLPISAALHLALLLIFYLLPPAPEAHALEYTPVTLLDLPPLPDKPKPDRANRPPEAIPPKPAASVTRFVRPGVPRPRDRQATGHAEGRDAQPGPGAGETAAPDIMRAKTGDGWPAPPGNPEGIGTGGAGLGPSGPTYGAAAQGGPEPVYPKLAQARGLEGTVVLKVAVNSEGGVDRVMVSASSGHPVLDGAAIRAAQAWRFNPAIKNGEPTSGSVQLRFRFADNRVTGEAL